jgi:hypothetical protein
MGLAVLVGLVTLAVVGGVAFAAIKATGGDSRSWQSAPKPSAVDGSGQAGAASTTPTAVESAAPSGSVAQSPSAASSSAASKPGDLVATDDFSGTGLNGWGVYESTAANGSSWLKSNVQVNNGELQIVGTGTTSGGLCWCSTVGNQLYGKWQVRAKFEAGKGFGQYIGLWPQSDKQSDGSLTFAAAYEAAKKDVHGYVLWKTDKLNSSSGGLATDATAWHTYTVEWRAGFIRMYVDDKLFYDTTTSKVKVVLPQGPLHLYLQQEVGPGDGVVARDASTPDRVTMHVDWVKLYR